MVLHGLSGEENSTWIICSTILERKMEVIIEIGFFLGALFLVIVGGALIMSFFDFLGWLVKKVTGIRIGNGSDD